MIQQLCRVEQAGGKYGRLTCPECGAMADYKFSAASGGCDTCGAMFLFTGGLDLTVANQGQFGPHWIELAIERSDDEID